MRGRLGGMILFQMQRLGFGPTLRRLRRPLADVPARWARAGYPLPPPHEVKLQIIDSYLRDGPSIFIESGTFEGVTLDWVARDSRTICYSIELDCQLFERAERAFRRRSNIRLLQGDSALVLPALLARLAAPALFWLDGHYCGGASARGSRETPVAAELEAILRHPVKTHRILIDDARLFDGTGGYPEQAVLLAQFERHPFYAAHVEADIIRILPRQRLPIELHAEAVPPQSVGKPVAARQV